MSDAALPVTDRRIDRMLGDYAEAHRGYLNRGFQAIALPLIVWSLIALLTCVPFPSAWRLFPGLDWSLIAALGIVLGYLALSWPIAAGLGVYSALSILVANAYTRLGDLPLWQLAVTTLVIGWGLNVAGLRFDRQRLDWARHLGSLIVGPAWLLSLLYRVLRLRY